MRTIRYRALSARLKRLESRFAVSRRKVVFRFGELERLPPDYKGEKHFEIGKRLPDQHGQQWYEFREVPGPEPNPPQEVPAEGDEMVHYVYIRFVKPYPIPDEPKR
jgi:hypothetical protein